MKDIKVLGYEGAWPNYCRGVLIVEIDGNIHKGKCLISGGSFCWKDEEVDETSEGPWSIDVSLLSPPLKLSENEEGYLLSLVNKDILWGCCGGCL